VEQFSDKINCVILHLVGHILEYSYDARTHECEIPLACTSSYCEVPYVKDSACRLLSTVRELIETEL